MEDNHTSDVYFPEEIIAEILLRLPFKPLFRNTCISKQWKSIISDANFGRSYMKRTSNYSSEGTHIWGYLPRLIGINNIPTTTDLNWSNDKPPPLYLPVVDFDRVLASSNGLLLCGGYDSTIRIHDDDDRRRRGLPLPRRLCVCNPLTKQSYTLPWIPVSSAASNVCLVARTDDNSAAAAAYLSYKVVSIRRIGGDCCISIYSSDTGRWSDNEHRVRSCPAIVFRSFPSTDCKGVLHWFNFVAKTLVMYDPYDSPDTISSIGLPSVEPNMDVDVEWGGVRVFHLGQQDSVVKFGEIEDRGEGERRLVVWMFYKGGWWIERTCLISPSWSVPAVFWINRGYFCCLGVDEEDRVDRCDIINDVQPRCWEENVPFALCPWASPCCGSEMTSSSVGYRKVSPVWVSPRNKYRGLLHWIFNR